jgi:membrane-bound lytic murein transglycosylase B
MPRTRAIFFRRFLRLQRDVLVSACLIAPLALSACAAAQGTTPSSDGAATAGPAADSPSPPKAAPQAGQTADFQTWLEGLRAEALSRGISRATVSAALDGLQPVPRVLELDRRQPETTLTLQQYLDRVVVPARIKNARARFAENRALLEEVGRKYGVQPRFIVALWGIETNFGKNQGGFSVVQALATLAYDGRRSSYFRGELFNALEILDADHIKPSAMVGSWAGAMGQSQFMPSSFLKYAVDYNGDGRRDIWHTKGDVFASAANYLKQSGWRDDQTWGREVRLPPNFSATLKTLMPAEPPPGCRANRFISVRKPLNEWRKLGVRRADGGNLPARDDFLASLALPEGEQGPALLVYENFRTTLKWNCSILFATAVGTLADRIADAD